MKIKDLLIRLWPIDRALVSDGIDEALEIIKEYMPANSDYATETFAPGDQVWTWSVPERYALHEA